MPGDYRKKSDDTRSGRMSKSKSSSSRSSSKIRPALIRRRSSQLSVKTVNVEHDSELNNNDQGPSSLAAAGSSQIYSESLNSKLSNLKITNKNRSPTLNEYIEVPFVTATLDASLPEDYLSADVLNTIQDLKIPKWHTRGIPHGISKLDKKLLKLTKIKGAMTNAIFKVEYPGLPSLLLRIYGPHNDTIIDRDYELQVLARLSVRNIGPSLYGCFANGRFEQFLENSQTLTKDDIRDWKISQRIARRMKELHVGVPLLRLEKEQGPTSLRLINKWLRFLETSRSSWLQNDENIQNILLCHNWSVFKIIVAKYFEWLENTMIKGPDTLVFCHNDTQYGNLLFSSPIVDPEVSTERTAPPTSSSVSSLFPSESNISLEEIINPPKYEQSQDSKLIVIDFEYAGANPAAFDLANHLSEWMHNYNCAEPYRCNVDMFPDREQMLNFVYSYVSHIRGGSLHSIDEEVKEYYNAILRWRAAAQLFWSVWAILQSGTGPSVNETKATDGGKYIFTTTPDEADVDHPTTVLPPPEPQGVDIDSFDYLGFCKDKIAVFWGDLVRFGVASTNDCIASDIHYLDTHFL